MTQTTSSILSLLVFVTFCHILSDKHLVSGQAYHFSKGWMPGKRTNVILQPGQFDTMEGRDELSEDDFSNGNRERGEGDSSEDEHRLDVLENMMSEPRTDARENDRWSQGGDDMMRLRTLLRTLPRIQSLPSGVSRSTSALHLFHSPSHSHTPPQCQIRPHLPRLIQTLLDKEIRRIAQACPTDTTNLQKIGEFRRLMADLLNSLSREN